VKLVSRVKAAFCAALASLVAGWFSLRRAQGEGVFTQELSRKAASRRERAPGCSSSASMSGAKRGQRGEPRRGPRASKPQRRVGNTPRPCAGARAPVQGAEGANASSLCRWPHLTDPRLSRARCSPSALLPPAELGPQISLSLSLSIYIQKHIKPQIHMYIHLRPAMGNTRVIG